MSNDKKQNNYDSELVNLGISINYTGKEKKYYVDSFEKFDKLISLIHKIHDDESSRSGTHFLYRGVTNESYKLRSSLRVNHLQTYEAELINEMYNKAPLEFTKCKSDFEMIAKMQHYGLPTRFIDFTKNPYVALWFACQADGNKKDDANGLVYFDDNADLMNQHMCNTITRLIQFNAYEVPWEMFYIKLSLNERRDYIDNLIVYSGRIFFEPPKIDTREINQQSIFLAECNSIDRVRNINGQITSKQLSLEEMRNITEEDISKYTSGNPNGYLCLGSLIKLENFGNEPLKKIIITKEAKSEILQELNYRGINKSFIFPTLNNSAEAIKSKYLQMYPGLGDEEYE